MPVKSRDGSPLIKPARPLLATGRVRHVGQPVVAIIAESSGPGPDAAELVELDIQPLPPVTTLNEAVREGAPQLHDEAPNNVCLDFQMGDADATAAAFRSARMSRLHLDNNRCLCLGDGAARRGCRL